MTNPAVSVLIKGVENQAYKSNYSVIICGTENTEGDKIKLINKLLERAIDGVIYTYPEKEDDYDAIRHLFKVRKIPVVIVGIKHSKLHFDYIRYD